MVVHSRTRAREIVCVDHLKGLGQAYAVCLTATNGYIPDAYYTFEGSHGSYQIALKGGPADPLFTSDTASPLACPGDDRPVSVAVVTAAGKPGLVPASYAYNVALPTMFRNASRVLQPSNTVTFYDGDITKATGNWQYSPGWAASSVQYRHNAWANFLYFDGHAERFGSCPDTAFDAGAGAWLASSRDTTTSPSETHTLGGRIQINPNSSPDNEFMLVLPDGLIVTEQDLKNNTVKDHSGFASTVLEYSGPAASVMVRPRGNGSQNEFVVDGAPYSLMNKCRYAMASSNMTVHLYNGNYKGGKAKGKWYIEVTSAKATLETDQSQ
jgi:prepilin-type processing-associated H-X9-DG protein